MRGVVENRASEVVLAARDEGRTALLDTEALELVRELGIATPAHCFVRGPSALDGIDLATIPGDRAVVKVVSPELPHRSDVGGVAFVAKNLSEVRNAVETMERRFAGVAVAGYTLNEFVDYDRTFGRELLIGLRRTEDFGTVVTFGAGGLYAEHLANAMADGRGVTVLAPSIPPRGGLPDLLSRNAVTAALTGRLRGQPALMHSRDLEGLVAKVVDFASSPMAAELAEFEINPLAITDRGPVALDVLARLSPPDREKAAQRPTWKLSSLLEPHSAAVVGVSRKMNVGRIILRNMIAEGFDRERLWIVKPGESRLDGCPCVPDIASLPGRVDLFVLAVDAAQVPEVMAEIVSLRKAESVIVIPGGLGERSGTDSLVREMTSAMAEARASAWHGPVVNGGNCLGVRSRPGRYDTLFIPRHKLGSPSGESDRVAVISQSGAFAVAGLSKLDDLNPKYVVTLGNQHDLTVGDYLDYLADDDGLDVFACYVEGFRPEDGLRFMRTAVEIVDSGRTVLLYRAGRTADGTRASSSHTASVAGDYTVARSLAEQSGVINVSSLADFADLTRMFVRLSERRVTGLRLGALSNAGFECVAMADNLGGFRLAPLGRATRDRIDGLFRERRLSGIVEARNPVDVTPILDDAGFEQAARAVLDDDNVDVGIIGCVPLSGAIATLPAGDGYGEDVRHADSVAHRLARLHRESSKAWVCVVDGGPLYDDMARLLLSHGVPTFRSADRALRLFGTYCGSKVET